MLWGQWILCGLRVGEWVLCVLRVGECLCGSCVVKYGMSVLGGAGTRCGGVAIR